MVQEGKYKVNDEISHTTFCCIFLVQVAKFVAWIWTTIRAVGSHVPSHSLMDLAIVTTKFSITSKSCFQDSPHVNIPNNIIKLFASMFPKKYQESLRLPLHNIFLWTSDGIHKFVSGETSLRRQKSSCRCSLH
jgi:hypothetical protein